MKCVRRRNEGPSRRARIGAFFAVLMLVVFAQMSASADLLDEPLELEDLLNIDELLSGEAPASTDVGEVVEGVEGTVTNLLDGPDDEEPDVLDGKHSPGRVKKTAPVAPRMGSWSTDRISLPSDAFLTPVRVSSDRVPATSYGAALADGVARTARRAADLAAPVAAPMILALFAVALLFVAARGPGRLVKVEEERKAFREQRTFRL